MSFKEKIRLTRQRKSTFDLSHEKKLSMKMGKLYPMFLEEVIPGDEFRVSSEFLMRWAPMIAPVMHRVHVYIHYFFVPNRIVWNQWEDFITGGEKGDKNPAFPQIYGTSYVGDLADYYGVPAVPTTPPPIQGISFSQLPFRGYQEIWNEYYRDQNLQERFEYAKDEFFTPGLLDMRDRCWEKDYLTSCLPFTQKGPEVSVGQGVFNPQYEDISKVYNEDGNDAKGNIDAPTVGEPNLLAGGIRSRIENLKQGQEIGSVTINALRKAARLQEWLEKNARAGSRYVESILAHFGVKSSDARLQRPEYLGGGKQPVVISEVLNTTGTTDNPQGNMSGHGIAVGTSNRFRKRFEEHGYVHGIMSVLPRTAYQQGLARHWSRRDKLDYYWPEFAHLGEQEVLNQEVFFNGQNQTSQELLDTFGYQSRYAEYKYSRDTVHGDFRDKLAFYHMCRIFSEKPDLNEDFVKSDPTNRIFAVQDGTDYLWVQVYNRFKAIRPIPYYGDPVL